MFVVDFRRNPTSVNPAAAEINGVPRSSGRYRAQTRENRSDASNPSETLGESRRKRRSRYGYSCTKRKGTINRRPAPVVGRAFSLRSPALPKVSATT